MKKLNIAVVCDPIDDIAGAQTSALRFSEKLSRKGHKIIFIGARYPHTKAIEIFRQSKLYRLPSVHGLPGQGRYYIIPNTAKAKAILEKEKIDLVYFILPTPFANSCILAAREMHIAVIGHSHTQPENLLTHLPRLFNNMQGGLSHLLYMPMIKLYNKADAVICPSEFSKNILKSQGLKNKVYVISNGVNRKVFQKYNAKRYSKMHARSEETKKILFVGRLVSEKNVSVLIKSLPIIMKNLKRFEVEIVGDGSEKNNLMRLSRKLGVEDKIKFFGFIDTKKLVELYLGCDVFVLPSLVELEGMVVLEAMACAKPVVVSNSVLSASPFMVKGNGFIFHLDDAHDLAAKILKILKNPELQRRMSQKSYELSKEYDIDKSVSKMEQVFLSVCKH